MADDHLPVPRLDLLRRADEAEAHPEPETLRPEAAEQDTAQDLLAAVQEHAALHGALARPGSAPAPADRARVLPGHVAPGDRGARTTAPGQRQDLHQEGARGFARATAPLAPAPDRTAAIKQRVMDAVRNESAARGDGHITVRSNAGQWMDFLPQVQVKVLHSEGRYNSILLRMAPGSSLPAHFHEDDEECVVLEGRVRIGAVRVSAGDYNLALSGSRHGELQSDSGALLFLRTTRQFGRVSAPPEG